MSLMSWIPNCFSCSQTSLFQDANEVNFQKGTSIDKVEERAISMHQLYDVVHKIHENCEPQEWKNGLTGEQLIPLGVNLYDLTTYLIKPITAKQRCSYVELVASEPQTPDWFVSHWWGEPVLLFVSCLAQHCKDRQLFSKRDDTPDTVFYWVCAYANNQWNVGAELGSDPSESSFRKAMSLASGTVSILDPGAVAYTRIWCIFEIYQSVCVLPVERERNDTNYLYDIYTVLPETGDQDYNAQRSMNVVGITDGYAAVDGTGQKMARKKRHRESKFPHELVKKALDIQLETAEASQDIDRRQILNFIAGGTDPSSAPPVNHESYDELNAILNGRFAAASWVKSLELQADMAAHAEALRDSRLDRLQLHFGGQCTQTLEDADVIMLAENLPVASLTTVFLGFGSCNKLTDVSAIALAKALGNCSCLKDLELRYESGPKISDKAVEALAESLLHIGGGTTLKRFHLDLSGCGDITDESCKVIATALSSSVMDGIEELFLDLQACKNLTETAVKDLKLLLQEARKDIKKIVIDSNW
eukprot:TRINITY_DN8994_c0_g3_i1.p1 TRINITY_DN8994_c0_g3~~TRINITY_DN8994_c0_g3_i1.p1  ORF type:complete len:532 (-),score=91.80 TRINITY_DN8994_c0_g3_i1:1683-3278(-)